MKNYLFTSESVTEGHPDKLCDLISDSILDACLEQDENSRVAIETFASKNLITIAGQITTNAKIDAEKIARETMKQIGYDNEQTDIDYRTCKIETNITTQSGDIAMGVDVGGAGDQGIMFGYACDETENYMPFAIDMAHKLAKQLTKVRKENIIPYLRPDGKTQVTVEYENDKPKRIETILISNQHLADVDMEQMKQDIIEKVIKPIVPEKYIDENTKIYVNPTGRFVIGGPLGDTGLTGRKLIVDTYGGYSRHGGGAFSGKDPSKVDRSAAYATRHIAKNLVAAGVADEILVQVSYAIGVAKPMGIFIDTYGTSKVNLTNGEIAKKVEAIFDMRPYFIEQRLKLRNPIYSETAAYGHMGRTPETVTKTFSAPGGLTKTVEVELFTWEKLDFVDQVKTAFGI